MNLSSHPRLRLAGARTEPRPTGLDGGTHPRHRGYYRLRHGDQSLGGAQL